MFRLLESTVSEGTCVSGSRPRGTAHPERVSQTPGNQINALIEPHEGSWEESLREGLQTGGGARLPALP